jgi:hypothetical protein
MEREPMPLLFSLLPPSLAAAVLGGTGPQLIRKSTPSRARPPCPGGLIPATEKSFQGPPRMGSPEKCPRVLKTTFLCFQ